MSGADPPYRAQDPRLAEPVAELDAGLGGIKWSSQHLEPEVLHGTTKGLGRRGDGETTDAISWPAAGGAA